MIKNKQTFIDKFLSLESSGGLILMFSAVLAMIIANTPLQVYYNLFLDVPVEIRVGNLHINKPMLLWINDGLMAVFFFLVGLELKRELVEGELSNKRNIILPGFGAIGGMLVPALIYTYFNYNDSVAMQGWAIPAATDLAFSLGVLALLGSRVPVSLKVFLTSLAIFDDIGAIIIIAAFYTEQISFTSILIVIICMIFLYFVNRRNPDSTSIYIFVGILMWVAMLKSGVHATLTGIVLSMFIPLKSKSNPKYSPLKSMEHDLHSVVAYFVLPVFAFANAGINLSGINAEYILHDVPLGIALGLIVGKQLGVFMFCLLAIKLKIARLYEGMTLGSLYGVAALCGIGFTMSLFIGSLAFENTGVNLMFDERLGIIIGSLVSGIIGYMVLKYVLTPKEIHAK